jgi:2-keto-4-pentenoate hydratase
MPPEMPRTFRIVAFLLLASAVSGAAGQTCPSADQVRALARDWENRVPVKGLRVATLEDAACGRALFVAELGKDLGRTVGYKAALTNPEVQAALKVREPVRGVLLDKMLLRSDAQSPGGPVVPANYASRPLVEADLVVEVRDGRIHEAKTDLELLQSLVRVYPFIELADLVVAAGEPVDGPTVVMINAGARLGVLGQPIEVVATPAFAEALAAMKVTVSDRNGAPLAAGTGSAILGHPLNAVRWLVDDLAKSGVRLRAGDLLSLGSFAAPVTPVPGQVVRVRYEGLPGNPQVSVTFK